MTLNSARHVRPQPTVVVMLTDGGPLVYGSGVTETLTWPPWTLQYEPFRWDQRLFCLTLRMPAISAVCLAQSLIFSLHA